MVLGKLVEEEIEATKFADRKEIDYRKRVKALLDTYSVFPVLDRPLEKELSRYLEELREERLTREKYTSRLEEMIEKEK